MKKQYLFILGILLIGIVIAGGVLDNIDKNVEYDKDIKDALESIGLDDWDYEDYDLGNLTKRCLKKQNCSDKIVEECNETLIEEEYIFECGNVTYQVCKNVINKCSGYMNESLLDSWGKEYMDNLGGVIINRTNAVTPEKTKGGKITPIEKK